ncbi:hypothetical protein F6R98_10185 [Candidatus Methylospira mobilis]|uniref:Uncharacterized protein n=1 Tax=Candidatus Methylospira mobilis TaxID=1808979 RepID=A0A5Q0BL56_9GAMM|nr:hypothetical protein [Candidatus Methylospira mobilis]QFY42934.1 hypothetical protein F6R98_10185 [Candidatus Methylospira mobilis]WNV03828.1 hypothetical protein RP726_15495 [Candidatus Methylospira mobilis]
MSILIIAGGQAVAENKADAATADSWSESTLSEKTQQQIQTEALNYQKCLNQQLMAGFPTETDPRAVTDTILRRCEEQLIPIKKTFDAEKVPDEISNRYLRQKRTQGARNVLKFVMSAQAVKAAEAASKQIDNQNNQPR